MNRINVKKLLNSKWTAVSPVRREKHFLITKVNHDDAGLVVSCLLQAVHSGRERELLWRELKDSSVWRFGWQ